MNNSCEMFTRLTAIPTAICLRIDLARSDGTCETLRKQLSLRVYPV